MQYMNTIIWEVKYLSRPKVNRYCKKCRAKREYISSESFRVNAQKKHLDIWLIYRCAHCGTTWNLTIYSRINPHSISREMLCKFTCNDSDLARQYAMDTDLIKKNGAEAETMPYSIIGDDIDPFTAVRVKIVSEYPSKLRLSKILREKLLISRKTFDEMVSWGMIRTENGADIRKCGLQRETIVTIDFASTEQAD